jgi:hypothetical protein
MERRRFLLTSLAGALAHERDRHRLGAHALARDAAGGVGGVEQSLEGHTMAARLKGRQRLWIVIFQPAFSFER